MQSKSYSPATIGSLALLIPILILILIITNQRSQAQPPPTCERPFVPVATPLTDLGSSEYLRFGTQPTGYSGGLYPGGSNQRPPGHEAAGITQSQLITPLNASGSPDPNGKIVMVSVGMSNAAQEFRNFIRQAEADPDVNPQLTIVNGAQAGQVSPYWVDPNAPTWQTLDQYLADAGLTPAQVQVAWIKETQIGSGDFPERPLAVQSDLEAIAQNLLINYPNIKIAYFSSRTRSYVVNEPALSPEPDAYESGFAVKWLIEKQITGNGLNYNPAAGPVVAPYLSWGPYLWIDGLNPRSDGLIWPASDLQHDCTHPAAGGEQKVGEQLLAFFKQDTTAYPWFTASGTPSPTPTATPIGTPTVTVTPPDSTPEPRAFLPVLFQGEQ